MCIRDRVQAVLQNLVGIGTAGSVGGIGRHIVLAYRAFAGEDVYKRQAHGKQSHLILPLGQ